MKLKEFVDTFVNNNALIRLWVPIKGGHKMILGGKSNVGMAWELSKGIGWQSTYSDWEIDCLPSIYVDDFYRDAVNISLKEK